MKLSKQFQNVLINFWNQLQIKKEMPLIQMKILLMCKILLESDYHPEYLIEISIQIKILIWRTRVEFSQPKLIKQTQPTTSQPSQIQQTQPSLQLTHHGIIYNLIFILKK